MTRRKRGGAWRGVNRGGGRGRGRGRGGHHGQEQQGEGQITSPEGADALLDTGEDGNTQSDELREADERKLLMMDEDKEKEEEGEEQGGGGDGGGGGMRIFFKEEDVGITEYIGHHTGFHGVIKQRYSDFIVHEIAQDGQIVKLTSLDVEDTGATDIKEEDEGVVYEGILTEEQEYKLVEFSADPREDRIIDISTSDDKEERKRIHHHIKSKYKNLESDTVFEDDVPFIRVVQQGKARRNKHAQYKRDLIDWPKNLGKYCRFVLYKENFDTGDCIGRLSKYFHINKNMFQHAGTKDKRAITSQEVTVYRVRAERLQKANRYFYRMALGNFRYVEQPLKLGQLQGNRFTIVLRNVCGDMTEINKAMTSLKESGFINYYGMQRFGTTAIPTHQVGRAILKSDYKEAAELILKPRLGEPANVSEIRTKWWESKNSLEMITKLPRKYNIERNLLEGLIKYGETNYANAFQKIHRNTRTMYLHGYQSYIWNRIVSRRINKYGLQPIIGDLVYKGDIKDVAFKEERDYSKDMSFKEEKDGEENQNGESEVTNQNRLVPTVVDAHNIKDYTITDVVLPLPGFDVMYPQNEVESWYGEMMAEDGLQMENLKHSNRQYALPGAYRRMIIMPKDVEWRMGKYSDVTKDLTSSDLDIIHDKKPPVSEPDGTMTALMIEMTLTSSCYATMALREVTKTDTSSAHQSTLNKGNQAEKTLTSPVKSE
ncbi:hypothetical protein FSP39_022552 [Pinctada imbricata]|uniref:TRUD domain-containing protein n=1 Tax=Pinctada imbricata TaxID=66713 RepID=A0AA88YML5_PINIB|nr:hypothetical protein FSP39_022552 [Pinctada imbricata]